MANSMMTDSNSTDDKFYSRQEWLDENGRKEHDVMQDETGSYIMVEGEEGMEKKYLPDNLSD